MSIIEQIGLLVRLRDSKERGAASMSLLQHIAVARECEQLGWIKNHTIGPSFFFITDAGLKKLNASKPMIKKIETEKPKVQAAPPAPSKPDITKRNPKGKAADVVAKMRQESGIVREEVLAILGWKAISMQEFCKAAGVELMIDKSSRPFRYRCK